MNRSTIIILTVLLSSASVVPVLGQADDPPEGVLCVTPVQERSCIAARVPMNVLKALTGVRWYNNDATTVFPKILVGSGQLDVPPVYSEALEVATHITGTSSGWSELEFDQPIASLTSSLYVIFQLPAEEEQVALGHGGGPGIGYRLNEDGPLIFMSSNGNDWVRLRKTSRLMIEPQTVTRTAGMAVLSAPLMGGATETPDLRAYETALLDPYPNPFNPTVKIHFTLKEGSKVSLSVYDLRGRQVRRLLDGHVERGLHVLEWSGRDDSGRGVSTGLYFARMQVKGQAMTKRLMLVK